MYNTVMRTKIFSGLRFNIDADKFQEAEGCMHCVTTNNNDSILITD
jgi:hypothetical protein